jgi:hypothetical protein
MIIKGDLNNDGMITYADLVILQAYLLEKISLTDNQILAADISGEGNISIFDLGKLQGHLLGIEMINEVIE